MMGSPSVGRVSTIKVGMVVETLLHNNAATVSAGKCIETFLPCFCLEWLTRLALVSPLKPQQHVGQLGDWGWTSLTSSHSSSWFQMLPFDSLAPQLPHLRVLSMQPYTDCNLHTYPHRLTTITPAHAYGRGLIMYSRNR